MTSKVLSKKNRRKKKKNWKKAKKIIQNIIHNCKDTTLNEEEMDSQRFYDMQKKQLRLSKCQGRVTHPYIHINQIWPLRFIRKSTLQ